MKTDMNSNPDINVILNNKSKNIVVSGKENSSKTRLAEAIAKECGKVLFCEFDREKYILYGKDISLTTDVILKNALFSCSNCKSTAEFEAQLDENTTVIIDNFDIASPSPYMRHLFTLPSRFIVLTRCEMKKLDGNVVQITLPDNVETDIRALLSSLNKDEYELLISLSCMLYYLEPAATIISSMSGVFDKESVRLYLGKLADSIDLLASRGLINVFHDGRICVKRNVCEYVVNVLKPEICEMPRFCKYIKNAEYIPDNHELLCLVTYFALKDEEYLIDVLKIMLSDAVYGNISTAFARNVPYFIKLFTAERLSQNDELYVFCKSQLELKDISKPAMASLCTMKICCHYLVGKSTDMYKLNSVLLDSLKESIDSLLNLDETSMKYAALNAINYCKNIFFYHAAIACDGTYNILRDNYREHEIVVYDDVYCNRENAKSLCFGYSCKTVELYLSFQKLLSMFADEYVEQIEDISISFWRTVKGYNTFYDFFDKKYRRRISVKDTDKISDKTLLDNKRFFVRGFDGGTKAGAKRYARMIVQTIKNSKSPLPLVYLVINPEFPICDETYKVLLDLEFESIISDNERISNLSKQDILETLVLNYNDADFSENLKNMYVNLFERLECTVSQNETSRKSLSESVCRMYNINNLENISEINFCDELYGRYHLKSLAKFPEELVSKAIFDFKNQGIRPNNKQKIAKALDCVKMQYQMENIKMPDAVFEKIQELLKI